MEVGNGVKEGSEGFTAQMIVKHGEGASIHDYTFAIRLVGSKEAFTDDLKKLIDRFDRSKDEKLAESVNS